MTRYLEIKPGSISETIKKLNDDYQAIFKKELEKTGKSIGSMTPDEKKAFFNKIDKMHNAKSEAAVNPYAVGMAAAMKATGDKPPLKKSTITKAHDIAKSIEKKEEVKEEIKVDKPAIIKSLQDRLKKLESDPDHGGKQDMIAYVKSKIKMLQSTKDEELTAGQKKLPPALQKAIEKKQKNEEVEITEITDEEEKSYARQITSLSNDKVMARINKKGDAAIAAIQSKIDSIRAERDKKRAQKNEELEEANKVIGGGLISQAKAIAKKYADNYTKAYDEIEKLEKGLTQNVEVQKALKQYNEEVSLDEGQYKEIDIRKSDLKLAKDKRQALKDKYNAIMANQAQGDDNAIGDQIRKLDMSIKKQEQELIDIMKKGKENEKNEAVDPERVQKLNQKIATMTTKVGQLDKSDPANKTKEAILKSDIATAKLRLQDLMQKSAAQVKKAVNEASKAKQSYKTLKMSLKKEQETDNKKKTLTDKPLTKIEVNPKIEG